MGRWCRSGKRSGSRFSLSLQFSTQERRESGESEERRSNRTGRRRRLRSRRRLDSFPVEVRQRRRVSVERGTRFTRDEHNTKKTFFYWLGLAGHGFDSAIAPPAPVTRNPVGDNSTWILFSILHKLELAGSPFGGGGRSRGVLSVSACTALRPLREQASSTNHAIAGQWWHVEVRIQRNVLI